MELLDVLDENGKVTGKKEEKETIHKMGIWHREVAVLIQIEKGEFLIQKRAATKKQAPNKWGMTAGHVDAGESFEEAMIREIKEELGIDVLIQDLKLIGIYKQAEGNEKITNNNYTKYYYYKTNKKIEDYTICLEELSQLKYITMQEMERAVENKDENCSYAQRSEMKKVIEEIKKEEKIEKKSNCRKLENEHASKRSHKLYRRTSTNGKRHQK